MQKRMTKEEFQKLSAETPYEGEPQQPKMTREDFEKLVQQVDEEKKASEQPISLGQRLKDIGSSVLHGTERLAQGGSNIGSAMAQHLLNLGEAGANFPNLISGGIIPKFSDHFEVPLYHPEAPESQLTEGLLQGAELAGEVTPLAKLGLVGASKIPGVAQLGERLFKNQALDKANLDLLGHIHSSSNYLSSIEADINSHQSIIDDLLKKSNEYSASHQGLMNKASEDSKNIIQKLLHGQEIGREYKPIVNEVKGINKNQLENYQKEMNNFKEQASKNWFLKGEKSDTYSLMGKSPEDVKRIQEASKITENILNEVKRLPRKSTKFKDAIENFNKSPSFDNVHTLQSMMGEIGSSLKSSSVGSERTLGGQYLTSRNEVKDLIKEALNKSSPGLGKKYSELSDRYLENIVPFKINTALNKLLTKSGAQELGGENISKILSGEDAATSNVFNQLSDKSKDLLLAQRLSNVVKKVPGKEIETDPNKFINEISKLPRERADKFLTPNSLEDISNLKETLDLASRQKNYSDVHNLAYKDAIKVLRTKQKSYDSEKNEIEKITDLLRRNKEKIENKREQNINLLKHSGIAAALGVSGVKGYNAIRNLLSGD